MTYIKNVGLVILSVYALTNVYYELTLGSATMGLYMFFNLPLGVCMVLLGYNVFKTNIRWQKGIAIFAFISAAVFLVPPDVYYLFTPSI